MHHPPSAPIVGLVAAAAVLMAPYDSLANWPDPETSGIGELQIELMVRVLIHD